ncbi:zinc-ribbon domain-containing protein [Dactylosporangium sp. AC04546]|uniref:zinc-ribbon domain-containing protein n=1 Tax=Dactylosporangium sp. AC04546 TaxID=2862460 RepID=UPI001EDDD2BE|nr:zinc-ribbon domain-containing protein [Dactylosporangium sp. AC04546]WVK88206.1 zinc-ribbon domain-containing protein [Dactylosporangium sp. AC04546]
MLLIFGWGWRVKHLRTLTLRCARCGTTAAHPLYRRVLKVSLFFIPLIPLRTRYTIQCTACGVQTDVDPAALQA